ncbi:MAG TPA: winged helix-turn-helix domain-containing protein [Verrucomicrobiota bacterium]|nr:winged helix-turn-helix domain-containing protein [Verrucomicrobiota bacterium]HRZ34878.1 winged helix-turn-helix domain-containing protein [Candidatus Paceibacterota bacterium]
MATWKSQAEAGELVVLTPLRAALDRQLGRRVKPSVVYRLVQRHRWRKVAPDTRHPKADPAVQAEWKKTLPEKLATVLTPEKRLEEVTLVDQSLHRASKRIARFTTEVVGTPATG